MRRAFFLFCLIFLLSLQLTAQFASPVTYPVQGSWGVAVADFNRDGKLDLAVAGGSGVSILLGNGDGTFQPYVAYPTGGGATSVIAADFNGDGIPDLAVAINGPNVSILLGNGDGTFQPYVNYPAGNFDQYLVAADFNGDGKLDLAVADSGASCQNGSVSILLGNGDGTFQPQITFTDGMQCSYAVMAADFNHDGKVDLAMLNGGGSFGIYILLGNGDGTFQQPVWFGGDISTPQPGVISDFNGDGNLDLSLATWLGQNVAVLFGDGQGNFSSPVFYGIGGLDFAVAAGDFNMDGKLDLVASNVVSSSVSVLLGNGDGTFQPAVNYAVPMGAWNIAVGDFNGDGAPDLAVTSNEWNVVSILLNTIRATTTTLTALPNPVAPHQVVTYDASVVSLSGKTVTGSVTFKDAGVPVATATLENQLAAWSTRYNTVGSHAMTVTYSGDANNSGSTSPTWTEYVVGASKTVLTTSGSPSLVGQPVTFTATVTSKYGQIPDGGTVTFYEGSRLLGSATLANQTATYTTTVLGAGTHIIKAVYAGDATLAPSMGIVRQQVLKYATTTALTSAPNPSTYGQSVTFSATVTSAGPTPTGKVVFMDAGKTLRSVALSAGVAAFTTSKLGVGTHPITAQYVGDADNATSTSSVLDQVVH